jgi:hypothetical protein
MGLLKADPEKHIGSIDIDLIFKPESLIATSAGQDPDVGSFLRKLFCDPDPAGRARFTRVFLRRPRIISIAVDFLVPLVSGEVSETQLIGNVRALRAPGGDLAFEAFHDTRIEGKTVEREDVQGSIRVADPAAIFAMKMFAMDRFLEATGEAARRDGRLKDAYDVCFILRNYQGGVAAFAEELKKWTAYESTQQAIHLLRKNLGSLKARGWELLRGFERSHGDPELLVQEGYVLVQGLLDRVRSSV